MNYILEGTVAEISVDENFFRINGTEGFAIKQADKKYNVLCSEIMPKEQENQVGIILSKDCQFPIPNEADKELLLSAVQSAKRIKITISSEEAAIEIDLQKLKELSSSESSAKKKYKLSLLSD